jgi:uncharacterized protein YdeI (YjbR/CyaY-like superfamily)
VIAHPAEHKGRRVVVLHAPEEWRDWLRTEGATSGTVWLTVWKQAAGPDKLTYDDVVDEALCHGWIDSTINRFDDTSYLLLLAPRKKGSVWSAVNKARIERLVAEGRMQPVGQAVIDAAIADGSWTILDSAEAMEEPDDLGAAIDAAGIRDIWESWTTGRRKQVLYRLVLAKTPPTRAKRIDEAIAALVGT